MSTKEESNYENEFIISEKSKTPYEKMEAWRVNAHGVQARFKKTNFVLNGSVDDIWLNTKDNSLILVDYKSQANEKSVSQQSLIEQVETFDEAGGIS